MFIPLAAILRIQLAVRFTQGATVGKTPVYCMKMAKCAQYSTVQYSTARTMHVLAATYKMYEAPYILYGAPYI